MANAFKCDVVNCTEISEGVAPANIVIEGVGIPQHICRKHTDEIVKVYFPQLLPKEDE